MTITRSISKLGAKEGTEPAPVISGAKKAQKPGYFIAWLLLVFNNSHGGEMKKNRLSWLYGLLVLTAVTAVCQYIVQGAMSARHVDALPEWFWWLDSLLWGLRAIVEVGVVGYAFTTTPQNKTQAVILWCGEILLIALITLTLGPVFRALGSGETLQASMSGGEFTLWNYLMSAYTSLMIGVVGYAYRVQPEGQDEQVAAEQLQAANVKISEMAEAVEALTAELQQAKQELQKASNDAAALQNLRLEYSSLKAKLDAAVATLGGLRILTTMPPRAQAELIAKVAGEEKPDAAALAAILGTSYATVNRGYKDAEGNSEQLQLETLS